MAYPPNTQETTDTNGVVYIESKFTLNGKSFRIKTNTSTGSADYYIITIEGDKLIASTDSGNNWSVKNDLNLIDALGNIDNKYKDTEKKRIDYFLKNYTLILNNSRAQSLNTKYPDKNQSAFANTPGYGNNPSSGAPGAPPPPSSTPTTDGINEILNLLTLDPNKINEKLKFGNVDEVLKGYKNLQYPIDALYGETQDHLVISMFKYKPPAFDALFKKDGFKDIINNGLPRGTPLKEYINSVKLPMPNSISDSNNVSWGEGEGMNNLSAAITSYISQNLLTAAGGQGGLNLAGQFAGMDTKTFALLITASQLGADLGDPKVQTLLNTAISSKVIGNLGFSVSPETILARGFGIVPNSNIELLFNSPTLRDFSFQYRLSPRSKDEALKVNQIIRFFKQGMAVKKLDGKGGSQSYFLGTPNVFKLRYRTEKNKQISGVNKIKVCALTGFSVNYAADGNWAAYDEGQPVSSIINMSFKELEPIYDTDYQTDIQDDRLSTSFNSTGDLDSVGSNDVGY